MTRRNNYPIINRIAPLFAAAVLVVACISAYAGDGRLEDDGTMDFQVNFRFPPANQQIQDVRTAIQNANTLICDATDRQVRFENVRLTAGAVDEDRADIWILPQQGRSGLSYYPDGSNLRRLGEHINLFSNGIHGGVIAHELGHHAFGLGEQYDEQRRFGGACGIGPGFDTPDADSNNSIMQQSAGATELSVVANHDLRRGDNMLCPAARAATNLVADARLDPAAPVTVFDPTSFDTARDSSALSGDVEVIDSNGAVIDTSGGHRLKLYFEHRGSQAWRLHFGIDAGDVGGTAGNLQILGSVDLTFNANGSLASLNPATPTLSITGLSNGANGILLNLDLGTIGGFDGVFEGGGVMSLNALSDGFPLCTAADCAARWNTTTNRFETADQTLVHPGLSDWETLNQNYPSITVPAGLPQAAVPAGCATLLTFIEDVRGADQVMLFIDRSGSMSAPVGEGATSTRLDFAKAAARAFIDLQAGRGAQVGLVSFEETPTLGRSLTDLAAADAVPFKTQVDGLIAGGLTGIGTALTAASFEFERVRADGRTRTAFLLSDGENNRGEDPNGAAQRLKDQGVRIFTIPVGSAADRDLLSNIAGSTGGVMLDASSGSELPPIYAELAARFRGESLALPRTESAVSRQIIIEITGPENIPAPGGSALAPAALPEQEEFPFEVEGGAERLNVMLSARNLDVNPNVAKTLVVWRTHAAFRAAR